MSEISQLFNWIEPGPPPKSFDRYGINAESMLLTAVRQGDVETLRAVLKYSSYDCDSRFKVEGRMQSLLALAISSHQTESGNYFKYYSDLVSGQGFRIKSRTIILIVFTLQT